MCIRDRYIEEKLKEEEEKILRQIEEKKKRIEELEKEKNRLEKIAEFLTTYSWIFKDYNIERIKKEFENLGIKVDVKLEGYKLKIIIDDNLIGY